MIQIEQQRFEWNSRPLLITRLFQLSKSGQQHKSPTTAKLMLYSVWKEEKPKRWIYKLKPACDLTTKTGRQIILCWKKSWLNQPKLVCLLNLPTPFYKAAGATIIPNVMQSQSIKKLSSDWLWLKGKESSISFSLREFILNHLLTLM